MDKKTSKDQTVSPANLHEEDDKLDLRWGSFSRRLGLALVLLNVGLIGAELVDYLLTHLDGPVNIHEYVFSPTRMPFVFAFIVIFAEQGWKKKLASDEAKFLKL